MKALRSTFLTSWAYTEDSKKNNYILKTLIAFNNICKTPTSPNKKSHNFKRFKCPVDQCFNHSLAPVLTRDWPEDSLTVHLCSLGISVHFSRWHKTKDENWIIGEGVEFQLTSLKGRERHLNDPKLHVMPVTGASAWIEAAAGHLKKRGPRV